MHILLGFLIIAALAGGFWESRQAPRGEIHLATADGPAASVRATVRPQSEQQYGHLVKQMYDYSCGSAALATLLRYHLGEDLDERQVIQGLLHCGDRARIVERRAFSLLDMKRFLGVLGYKSAGYKAAVEDLRALDRPGILPVEIFGYRHFAVFRGIFDDHVFLADPWRGNISLALGEFEGLWHQNVIFLVDAPDSEIPALLALGEEDLRFIDEEQARKIIFHARDMGGLDELRRLQQGPGRLDDYRR